MTGGDGEFFAKGESYKTKAGFKDGIEAVKRAAAGDKTD